MIAWSKASSSSQLPFNSTVGSRKSKTRYYGGSESNDFRVACALTKCITEDSARKEKQEGKTYVSNIAMNLGEAVSAGTTSESITGLGALFKEDIPRETLFIYEEAISTFTPRSSCPGKKV